MGGFLLGNGGLLSPAQDAPAHAGLRRAVAVRGRPPRPLAARRVAPSAGRVRRSPRWLRRSRRPSSPSAAPSVSVTAAPTRDRCAHGGSDRCAHGGSDRCAHGGSDRCAHGGCRPLRPPVAPTAGADVAPTLAPTVAHGRPVVHRIPSAASLAPASSGAGRLRHCRSPRCATGPGRSPRSPRRRPPRRPDRGLNRRGGTQPASRRAIPAPDIRSHRTPRTCARGWCASSCVPAASAIEAVLAAMALVPRERFLPPAMRSLRLRGWRPVDRARPDDLPAVHGRAHDRGAPPGCVGRRAPGRAAACPGRGHRAPATRRPCWPRWACRVTTIERDEELAARAAACLTDAGHHRPRGRGGRQRGVPRMTRRTPAIVVAAAAPDVPGPARRAAGGRRPPGAARGSARPPGAHGGLPRGRPRGPAGAGAVRLRAARWADSARTAPSRLRGRARRVRQQVGRETAPRCYPRPR